MFQKNEQLSFYKTRSPLVRSPCFCDFFFVNQRKPETSYEWHRLFCRFIIFLNLQKRSTEGLFPKQRKKV